MVLIVCSGEKVLLGAVVHRSKPVEFVCWLRSSLQRLFFCYDYRLLHKHVINLVTDVDERVISLVFKLVDPYNLDVLALNVDIYI